MALATVEDINAAYRIILERDPDPSGLAEYSAKAKAGMELRQLRETLLSSTEYSQKSREGVSEVDISDGLLVSADANETEFGSKIHRAGTWEPQIIGAVVAQLSPGDVFVDVGANIGVMSFHAARQVGTAGKVIAFEPDGTNVIRFLEGVAANKFDNIILFQLALSNQAAVLSLAGGSNAYLTKMGPGRLVQAIRGDSLLANEPRIDLVKLDIEGFEPFALEGLSETLKRHRPSVLCAFNPRCLKDHASVDPALFAEQLFQLTPQLEVIEHDGTRNSVSGGEALIQLWEDRNKKAVASGFLPDGMLHFDVLFKSAR